MASGKSTIGPDLAARLDYTFIDLDGLITTLDGRSIPEIFAEDGEDRFRALESEVLRKTLNHGKCIVALGGGTVVDDDNRSFAKEHGRIIYLRVDPETVVERVADEADQRPLLQDEDGRPLSRGKMRARIEQMLVDRTPAYRDAHAMVDATRPVPEVVDAVAACVRENEWA